MKLVIRIRGPEKDRKEKMFQRGKKRKSEDSESSSLQTESACNWRDSAQDHKQRNILALKKGVLTDVNFEVGPASVPFKGHRLILALASPVFEAMFYGDLAEKGDKIVVTDILPDGFEHMLEFIYTEDVHFKSEFAAFQAWIAADKYCLNQLKKKCDTYFNECALQPSNIWLLLENSVFINCASLTNRCLEYLSTHIENSVHIPGFLETSADTLQRVLLLDPMAISELSLLRALLRWGKYKVENDEAESVAEALTPLLKHIRFGAMSSLDFSTFMSEGGDVLCPQDAVAIFMHISNPACFKLPDWCSPRIFRRSYTLFRDGEDFEIPLRDDLRSNERVSYLDMLARDFDASRRRRHIIGTGYHVYSESSFYHEDEDSSSSSSSASSTWDSDHTDNM